MTSIRKSGLADHSCLSELDSHADTCCFGQHCLVLGVTAISVEVVPFLPSIGTVKDISVCTVAVAYDDPLSHSTYILIFHQVLFFPTMLHNLLCPQQLRNNQLIVNDVPLAMLSPSERTVESHCIISRDPPLRIPLELNGIMSGFVTRAPQPHELDDPGRFPE